MASTSLPDTVTQCITDGYNEASQKLRLKWEQLTPQQREQVERAEGSQYEEWPNWDYGNLFFQKTYVARKFQSTARQVYRCLEALHDCMPTWSPGSAPLIVLLGGGPAAEIIAIEAFFKQHFAGTTAQYRIIDEVDWGVAGNIMGRPVVTQHLDMLQASPAWWADLASAWLMMGWYVHDILQSKWDNVILEQVCSNGAGVLLGGPQGYSVVTQEIDSSNLQEVFLGKFANDHAFFYCSRRQMDPKAAQQETKKS